VYSVRTSGFKSVHSKGVVPVEDKGNNNIREPHVDVGHLYTHYETCAETLPK